MRAAIVKTLSPILNSKPGFWLSHPIVMARRSNTAYARDKLASQVEKFQNGILRPSVTTMDKAEARFKHLTTAGKIGLNASAIAFGVTIIDALFGPIAGNTFSLLNDIHWGVFAGPLTFIMGNKILQERRIGRMLLLSDSLVEHSQANSASRIFDKAHPVVKEIIFDRFAERHEDFADSFRVKKQDYEKPSEAPEKEVDLSAATNEADALLDELE